MPPHALAVRYTPAVLVPGKWGGRARVRDEVQQYDKIICQSISTHTHTREKMFYPSSNSLHSPVVFGFV